MTQPPDGAKYNFFFLYDNFWLKSLGQQRCSIDPQTQPRSSAVFSVLSLHRDQDTARKAQSLCVAPAAINNGHSFNSQHHHNVSALSPGRTTVNMSKPVKNNHGVEGYTSTAPWTNKPTS